MKSSTAIAPLPRSVVAVIDGCPTIVRLDLDGFTPTFSETSYANDQPGSYVRRWTNSSEAVQCFGSWGGGAGSALMWDRDAVDPEDKARQIAAETLRAFQSPEEHAEWRSAQIAVVRPGVLASEDRHTGDLDVLGGDAPIPYGATLFYVDASGTYVVERAVAPYVPGRHSDTGYALTRDGVVVATAVRPMHRDSDTCGALAMALQAALRSEVAPAPIKHVIPEFLRRTA